MPWVSKRPPSAGVGPCRVKMAGPRGASLLAHLLLDSLGLLRGQNDQQLLQRPALDGFYLDFGVTAEKTHTKGTSHMGTATKGVAEAMAVPTGLCWAISATPPRARVPLLLPARSPPLRVPRISCSLTPLICCASAPQQPFVSLLAFPFLHAPGCLLRC